ncbi:MAG: hypothetical protein A2W23_09375 [Planctomycetes bacterium RBG_16_43_13]|nr:MAG: hypothetical protein A2W23_09375 [Planctomycetes bacterium RBG_16_43_13]
MKKAIIAILGLAAVAIVAISYAQEQQGVSISRGEITIPTYPWGPDDINPYSDGSAQAGTLLRLLSTLTKCKTIFLKQK